MNLTLDPNSAKQADNIVSSINESGKYIGVITRAEHLRSSAGTEGLGLSFKSNTGQTADYLDIYTTKENGEVLAGTKTVNAILACTSLRGATLGRIKCEKWNKDAKRRDTYEVDGYPELMGKKIGLLLQKELQTHQQTGADVTRMNIFGVFSADTELTASEILDRKTNPERLPKMIEALAARPVRDSRDKGVRPARAAGQSSAAAFSDMDDDIPFANPYRGAICLVV